MASSSRPHNGLDGLDTVVDYRKLTTWERWSRQPLGFIAGVLYGWGFHHLMPNQSRNPLLVVCISDTHNSSPEIPAGNILIHTGGLSQDGSAAELQHTLDWLRRQPHQIKIVVAGNQDTLLDPRLDGTKQYTAGTASKLRSLLRWHDILYLENEKKIINFSDGRRLTIFGSPYTPQNGNWAFQYPRHMDFWASQIPENVDILVTCGPPRAHLDGGYGDVHLLRALWRTRPRLHVFGQMHVGPAGRWLHYDAFQKAYENTVMYEAFWFLLVTLFWWFQGWTGVGNDPPQTFVVNAAVADELNGGKKGKPLVVLI